ncbi:MAG: glycerol dehydrogenase [Actinobacteria bacterium]|nr:glycerol dehydrogenase [Actinomycetota bacterium]
MNLSVFQSPARYVQGPDASAQLGPELAQVGVDGPVLILAGGTAHRELSGVWQDSLAKQGLPVRIEAFGGQCTAEEISRVTAMARDFGAVAVVGAGGGQVLDTSRAVAADLDIAAINCPTIASSDAPCSALSVLYHPDHSFDTYRFYRSNPKLVLVDSRMVARAPVRFLSAGLGDAVATWWEARAVRESDSENQLHGMPTATGTALAHLCYQMLLENAQAALSAVRAQSVTPALERIIEANTLLSGLGFESGGLAAAHSIHNGLTTQHETADSMHGEKVAFGLLAELVLEGRSEQTIREVLSFSMAAGLPVTLAQVGLADPSAAVIAEIAERAVAPGETIHHEPVAVTAGSVADAIRVADEIGRGALTDQRD